MNTYKLLAERYEELFPPSRSQISFISRMISRDLPRSGRLLDIGCGTGALAAALIGKIGKEPDRELRIDAIDLDQAMIDTGKRLHAGTPGLHFHRMDMRKIGTRFSPERFHGAVSMGNTLVHLDGPESITAFFRSVHSLLGKSALFILQILNYDYILEKKIFDLPPITIPGLQFTRRYQEDPDGVHIIFETTLKDQATGEISRGNTVLYPLRKTELMDTLSSAGFSQFEIYGSFDGAPLTADSLPLIAAVYS